MAMIPKSFEECASRVMAAGKINHQAALDLLQQVHDRAEDMRRLDKPDPIMEAVSELAGKVRETARLDRLDAIKNATKRTEILSNITGFKSAVRTLRDILHGSNVGSRENIQSEWQGRAAKTNAAIDFQIKKAELTDVAISGQLDREVRRAMWAERPGEESDASAPAKAMAKAYVPAIDDMRTLQNEHGARIGKDMNYVAHVQHDRLLMRRGGRGATGDISEEEAFQRWWSVIEPTADERTFAGIEPKMGETEEQARLRFGRSFFNATESGIHMTTHGVNGMPIDEEGTYIPPAYEGTHNIAKKVSQPRVWIFKDADAQQDYLEKYGRYRTIYEAVQGHVEQASRNIALMDKLGTNPGGNLNIIIRRVQEKYRDGDLDGLKVFNKQVDGIQNVMARLDGSANNPTYNMWYSLGEGARSYYDGISLGGVGITHLASVWATVPSELRHHGIGVGTDALGVGNLTGTIGNVGRTVAMLVRGKGPMERQAILSDLGAYAGGYAYNLSRNWNIIFEPGNTLMGRIAALHSLFMKATGVHWVFDTVRGGVREFTAHNLARQLTSDFKEIDPHLQNMLGKDGIGEAEWNQLKELKDLPTWEGRSYLTPKDALATPAGQKLADKLMMYYHDAADHAVVVPGVRERAALYGKMRPGDWRYEMTRMLMQFKIWPVAASNQILGREIHMALNAKDAAWGIGLTIALSTIAGYTRMVVNDVALGNQPRDPRDPNTLIAAMAQGGGLGIFGDLMFGEANRLGASGLSAVGGPLATDSDALLRIYGRWRTSLRTGSKYDPWPDIARFGIGHIPFANLVYLKGALDYLLWYHLLEAASPGWWERTNRRMQVEQGRTMAGYVPGGKIPYTPWGIGTR